MSRFYSKSAGIKTHRALYLAVLAALSSGAYAVPEGGRVALGAAQINDHGDTLTIEQSSQRAVLEFDSFNIDAQQTVNFIQPSRDSVALNRVLGNDLSAIYGTLNANGQVYLINPHGVLFGAGAQVNVGGLVATTLDISDQDFLNQRDRLVGSASGVVENRGTIHATERVTLVAPEVINSGDIQVPGGEIMLHSSRNVLLQAPGSDIPILMEDPQLSGRVINEGTLSGDRIAMVLDGQGSRDVYDNAINNSGLVRAVAATGEGGTVELLAPGGDVVHSGAIDVNAAQGPGGSVTVRAQRYGQRGTIDASGRTQGDGGDLSIVTDQTIALDANSRISADGAERGNGGEVLLYADNDTWFPEGAEITARGGDLAGDGGFVEISGREFVDVYGRVDVGAARGEGGLWYIDPTDIEIGPGNNLNGMFVGPDPFTWDGTGVSSIASIGIATIQAALMNGSVIINTASTEPETGHINVRGYVGYDGIPDGRTLSLIADGDIIFQGGTGIADSTPGDNQLNVELQAGGDIMFNGSSTINVGAGTFGARAGGDISITEITSLSTSGQAIVLESLGGELMATNIDASVSAANGGVVLGAATGINLFDYVASQGLGLRHYGTDPFNYVHSGDLLLTSVGLGADAVFNISASGSITYTGTGGGDLDGATNASLTLTSGSSLALNGDLADLTGGVDNSTNLSFIAGTDFSMADGVEVNAGAGVITVDSMANAQVSGLVSTSASAQAISINSGGALSGSAGESVSLTAANGGLVVNAANGVANLDTQVASVDITAGMGDIVFNEVDDVQVIRLNAENAIDVTAGGGFTLPGSAPWTANQFSVHAGGAIVLPDAGLSVPGALTLDGADITAETPGGTLDLSAATMALTSEALAGDSTINATAADLALTQNGANTISVDSTSDFLSVTNNGGGELNVSNSGALTLASAMPGSGTTSISTADSFDLTIADATAIDLNGANGVLALNSGNDLLVNVNLIDSIGTGNPTLALSATNDLTFSDSAIIDIGAGDLSLSAGNGNVNLGRVTGDAVTISAGQAINDVNGEALNITANTATLTAGGNIGASAEPINGDLATVLIEGADVFFDNTQALSLSIAAAENVDLAVLAAGDLTVVDTPAITGTTAFSLADGDLLVADAGLIVSGDLSVNANTIRALDAPLLLQASNATLTLGADGLDTLMNVDFDTLALNIAGTQALTVNDSDDLQVTSLATSGDLNLNTGGHLTIDDGTAQFADNLTLSVGGDLTVAEGILAVQDTLILTAQNLSDGEGAVDIAAATVIVDLQSSTAVTLSTTIANLDFSSSGTELVTLNEADGLSVSSLNASGDVMIRTVSGDIVFVADTINAPGLTSLLANEGELIINDAGLTTNGDLMVVAEVIGNSAGQPSRLLANNADITLSSGSAEHRWDTSFDTLAADIAGDLIVTDTNGLTLNRLITSGAARISTSGEDLTLTQTPVVVGDLELITTGRLIVPQSGLTAPGQLRIDAQDLTDNDRTINVAAQQLWVRLTGSSGDNIWQFAGKQLDARVNGQASVHVVAADGLMLQDLDGDGQAIAIDNGNFSLALSSGDLQINSNVSASDYSANGTRAGIIDLHVASGDIQVGIDSDVSIVSVNNVDSGATSAAGGENGIRLRLADVGTTKREIILGNGMNNVDLRAVGGDILLDARAEGTVAAAQRNILHNAGVRIAAYTDLSDSLTGKVLVNGLEQPAQPWQQIRAGRTLAYISDSAAPLDLGGLMDEVDNIDDSVTTRDQPAEQGAKVSEQFDLVFGGCNELDENNSPRCRVNTALKAFLSHWLVGGEMPPKSEI